MQTSKVTITVPRQEKSMAGAKHIDTGIGVQLMSFSLGTEFLLFNYSKCKCLHKASGDALNCVILEFIDNTTIDNITWPVFVVWATDRYHLVITHELKRPFPTKPKMFTSEPKLFWPFPVSST